MKYWVSSTSTASIWNRLDSGETLYRRKFCILEWSTLCVWRMCNPRTFVFDECVIRIYWFVFDECVIGICMGTTVWLIFHADSKFVTGDPCLIVEVSTHRKLEINTYSHWMSLEFTIIWYLSPLTLRTIKYLPYRESVDLFWNNCQITNIN